ncbi:Disease resistance protein [Artemisia annua]|uniref:Disease resistance protein n=1 Tax=Artemisia annua TaxID=35608 RepID=A0A2U1MG38_ARTAN|nr:Disease resistance protein [Artemisia annua]
MINNSPSQAQKIYEALVLKNKNVNIYGPPGVGKTRIAKRISKRVVKEKIFDLTLWVFMGRKYTKESLLRSIAQQLNLRPTIEEWEDEDDKDQKDDTKVTETEKDIALKMQKKLQGKRILLILDDVLDGKTETENEKKFWEVLKSLKKVPDSDEGGPLEKVPDSDKRDPLKKVPDSDKRDPLKKVPDSDERDPDWVSLLLYSDEKVKISVDCSFKTKLLISRSKREDEGLSDENKFEVKPLPREVSNSLLKEKMDVNLRNSEVLCKLGEGFIELINDDLPSTVTMIAKSLNYFGIDASGVLKKELEEAKELKEASKSFKYSASKLLCMMDEVLPIGILKDLWWPGHHFFRDSGSVHYSDLITYWILEGYLGLSSMTKLYKKGHGILLELMDCGVLKVQEEGYVIMDKTLIIADNLYKYVDQTPSLGLATFFTTDRDSFGGITHEDGMLKTPRTHNKQSSKEECQNLSTILLDGTPFSEEEMQDFLEREKMLQVVTFFNLNIKSLPMSLDMMDGLRVLVLRGCEFLVDAKIQLKSLQALEISGARTLKLKSLFFKNMSNLKSLNLSGLSFVNLPQAIYSLDKLQWLIVKDCRRLKQLESLSKLEHLMVIDLSGNTSLETVDKNFLKFKNLQSLNLSNTLVSTTPLLKNIGSLTHLFCRDCKSLGRLRGLTQLTSLQTIDISGSKEFEEFHDSSLESLRSLKTINLSGTALDRLPLNISKPRYLYLKNCLMLKQLSCIESLEKLEVFDLSGSSNLKEIEDEFFDHMTSLRVLNLSETNVEGLPSLSKLSNLRELLVSHCSSLVRLPSLESATKLEILDASNCNSLEYIECKSIEAMTRLQKLDLSETKIKSLPILSTPSNLRQLLLKNCSALQNLELSGSFSILEELNLSNIESLKGAEFVKDVRTLRILDLSYTSLEQLPPLSKLTNLTHLSLAGFSVSDTELDLEPFSKLEVLDLSLSSIKCLPNLEKSTNLQKLMLKDCPMLEGYTDVKIEDLFEPNYLKIPEDISKLIHLDYLEFPNIKVDSSHEDQWSICKLSDIDKPPVFVSGSQFLQTLKKNQLPHGPYHLCATPVKVERETGDRYLQKNELVHDIYFQTHQFSQYKANKSVQIRGFSHCPKGIENIINNVDLVFLIDYKLKGLPSGFDALMLNKIRGCWLERCGNTVTIFSENEGNDKPNFELPFLEDLGISNMALLESIYQGKRLFRSFDSLKSLYIDCCPKLSTVFSSVWLPTNLEVLQIKHCEKIVSLIGDGGKLPKLMTLHLWELPELEDISASFPSLQTLKIGDCPKLKQTRDKFEISRGLKTLWISGATSLKSLCIENEEIHEPLSLVNLKLENCSMLERVLFSSSPLDNIDTIEIRSCEKIKTLFTDINDKTLCLNTLHLEDLPVLETCASIWTKVKTVSTQECPNLKPIQFVD